MSARFPRSLVPRKDGGAAGSVGFVLSLLGERGGFFFPRCVGRWVFFAFSFFFSVSWSGVEWTGLDWTSLDEPEVRQMVPNPLPFLFKYTCARNARADRRKLHRQTVAATYACIVALALASP